MRENSTLRHLLFNASKHVNHNILRCYQKRIHRVEVDNNLP